MGHLQHKHTKNLAKSSVGEEVDRESLICNPARAGTSESQKSWSGVCRYFKPVYAAMAGAKEAVERK